MGVVVIDGGVLAEGDALDADIGEDGDTSKAEAGYITLVTFSQYITQIALLREHILLHFDVNTVN